MSEVKLTLRSRSAGSLAPRVLQAALRRTNRVVSELREGSASAKVARRGRLDSSGRRFDSRCTRSPQYVYTRDGQRCKLTIGSAERYDTFEAADREWGILGAVAVKAYHSLFDLFAGSRVAAAPDSDDTEADVPTESLKSPMQPFTGSHNIHQRHVASTPEL